MPVFISVEHCSFLINRNVSWTGRCCLFSAVRRVLLRIDCPANVFFAHLICPVQRFLQRSRSIEATVVIFFLSFLFSTIRALWEDQSHVKLTSGIELNAIVRGRFVINGKSSCEIPFYILVLQRYTVFIFHHNRPGTK